MAAWFEPILVAELGRARDELDAGSRARLEREVTAALAGVPARIRVALRLSVAHRVSIDAIAHMLGTSRLEALRALDGARLTVTTAARIAVDAGSGRLDEPTRQL